MSEPHPAVPLLVGKYPRSGDATYPLNGEGPTGKRLLPPLYQHEFAHPCPACADEIAHLRNLLKKYIDHVGGEEGTTFIANIGNMQFSDVVFTPEEKVELETIERELHDLRNT